MSLEVIDMICQAEEAAIALKADTIANAKRAVEKAEEEGRLAMAQLEDKITAELKARKELAMDKAKAEVEAILAESAKEAEALRSNAALRLNTAAEHIVERIVNG